MKKINLEKDEQALLDSFERGEWKPVKGQRSELIRHRLFAANTLRKDRRVNIRISTKDLEEIQTRAAEDGVPYQTLMASVLHRFVSGTLVQSIRRPKRDMSRKLSD